MNHSLSRVADNPDKLVKTLKGFTKALYGLLAGLVFLVLCAGFPKNAVAGEQWEGEIPGYASEPEQWIQLVEELSEQESYLGVYAALQRMIIIFQDLPSKEYAYYHMIQLLDKGYSFALWHSFLTGDLEPDISQDPHFAQSYYLVKGVLNEREGAERWSKDYFSRLNTYEFSKYKFYQAIETYKSGNLKLAVQELKEVLSSLTSEDSLVFTVKVARTLARVYFELEDYNKSWEIYGTFLLKLNPVVPTDWLEGAWSLYYLGRDQEALGLLYNLERINLDQMTLLEKYIIRGLIYSDNCATAQMEVLIANFNKDFSEVLKQVKEGKTLHEIPALARVAIPENVDFNELNRSLKFLKLESAKIKNLSGDCEELAHYLYESEIKRLEGQLKLTREASLYRSAAYMINLTESLRFLLNTVERQKFDPDRVFKKEDLKSVSFIKRDKGYDFAIPWKQDGDFWRDEQLHYQGKIENQCEN